MKRLFFLWMALLLLLAGTALAEITSVEQLNQSGITVGTELGCAADEAIRKELPEAQLEAYNDKNLGYADVASGRLDAFIFDRLQMELAIQNGVAGVHLLDENLGDTVKVAVGISPVSPIPDLKNKINTFIAQLRQDGTLDDMYTRWAVRGEDEMPKIDLPEAPSLHLTVGTSGIVPPYSYYAGETLKGYDIELANRLAAWLGADLEFKVYDYGAIVAAAISGDVDCVMANLNVTEERAEVLPFSDTLYELRTGVMVRGEAAPKAPARTFGIVGVQTGSSFDAMVAKKLPDAQVDYYNTKADLVAALTGKKIDAFVVDEPVAKLLMREDDRLTYLPDYLDTIEFALVFPKNDAGQALRDQFNAFLKQLPEGTLDQLATKWLGDDEAAKTMPDIAALKADNGTLRLATESGYAPFEYIRNGEVVGYDMDIAARFCEACGYGLEIVDMNFDGILPAVQTGKADFAAAGIAVTPERAESVLFSEPNFSNGTVLVVLKEGEEKAAQGAAYGSLDQLKDRRIGIPSGTSFDLTVKKAFPEAELFYFNNQSDLLMALTTNKIDAFPSDEPVIRYIMNQRSDISYIPEYLENFEFAYCFPKTPEGQKLRDEISEFISGLKANGSLDAIASKWFGTDESAKTLPKLDELPATNGTLVMATDGDYMPFEYVREGKVVGYDVDIAAQFCQAYGYGLKIEVMNLDAVLPAVQSGKCSFAGSAITITPERSESVLFSEPNYIGGTVMVVSNRAVGSTLTPDDFNGKRAGVITGSFHDSVIKEALPKSTVSNYNSYPDLINAMKSDKIDYFLASTEVAGSLMAQDSELTVLSKPVRVLDIGAMFAKDAQGDALRAQMDEFIEKLKADGTLDEIYDYWRQPSHESTPVDMSDLTGQNGTLHFATSGTKVPISFVANGQIAGTDPDIAVRFCREYGYDIEVSTVDTSGIISGIVKGRYDFSLSDMVITEERKESVSFSVPYHGTELLLMTLASHTASPEATSSGKTGFIQSLKDSFERTFLREERWRLFLRGVLTTLLITVLSIIFGTALGYLSFMLCRNGNPVANVISKFCLWLVQGMPMVVLLMILYYVVFGSVAISGVVVAVVGFTLTFGAAVFGLLKMGVGAVDGGQYEAAYALGYSNRKTFYRIILPQAIPHILPAYRGEIVGLIKATAIVGYIAVQDLTKMGDIVRSRTYEAFFPLIAVTVIYFVLEELLRTIIGRIGVNYNPKRRKPANILKGVNTDDQN